MKPVFISGYNKSGTTLFLSLLDAHHQLCVFPEELHFFNSLLGSHDRKANLLYETGIRLLVDPEAGRNWSKGKSWNKQGYPEFNGKLFKKKLDTVNLHTSSLGDLLSSTMDAFAEVEDHDPTDIKYWVTKTTQNELYISFMAKYFSNDLFFFYIIRDPRDVYLSISKRQAVISPGSTRTITSLIQFCTRWSVQLHELLRLQKKYTWIHTIRYEDIVADTETIMNQTSNTLGIAFSDSMLRPTRHGNSWSGNSVFDNGNRGISGASVGRYSSILRDEEILLIEHLCKNHMMLFDYPVNSDSRSFDKREYRREILTSKLHYNLYYRLRWFKKYIYFRRDIYRHSTL